MSRLRYNGLATGSSGSTVGLTLGGSLTSGATSVTFSAALTYNNGTAVPTIVSPDYIPLSILDTNGNLSEIVYLTAYTSAGTTGTITRGQEGTTGVAHSSGDKIVSAPTTSDVITPGYLGKNAIGASWQTLAVAGTFKRVTTSGATVLLGVAAHIRMSADVVANFGVALYSDNAGTPERLLSYNGSTVADTILLNAGSSEVGASAIGRWYELPLTYQLAAATSYWVGIFATDFTSLDLAYDTGGSDRTFTGSGWLADWAGRYTAATTTRDHSIRANILA